MTKKCSNNQTKEKEGNHIRYDVWSCIWACFLISWTLYVATLRRGVSQEVFIGLEIMTGAEKKSVTKGCIKATKGPWVIRKTTKHGDVVIKLRHPSERERQKNKQRERTRRAVAKNIFAGLRAHGNFSLPKHADNNDLLKALCEQAGWHVDEDGNIYKKDATLKEPISGAKPNGEPKEVKSDEEEYCTCNQTGCEIMMNTMALGEQREQSWNMGLSL